ncbi:MAG: 3'-5' exonuclease [Azoarcus sp.]|nr:3'-5' exonuclease [Azoarcus sp.]
MVLNTRASDVNVADARLLSIAAIAVEDGRISANSSFMCSIDDAPQQVLSELVEFVANGPVVVFNAELNRRLIERALDEHLGQRPDWLWLDLYWLLPALFGEVFVKPTRLARWMDALHVATFQRFHALGDAWVLAKLLLAVQSRARAEGRHTAHSLADLEASLREVAIR